ncbi:fibroblast growth factor receptor 2-like, partial [Argopecten irradians]|uniref:fibroblast growth factor receptor 2-like n=1 Tax=Argopecten irradians TaxID=31199 RepID=UPI00370FC1FC
NLAYSDVGDEDVYLYGQMVFEEDQAWKVRHDQVSLVEKMTVGRFADIFKASQKSKKNNRSTVIAKVLKESHTEIDEMVMTAKINFFATKVGSHPNVVQFVGAVLDNEHLGPFMLLEFCETGVMRTWLQNQKTKVTDSIVDTLFRITFDIARGMEYLASNKIIHRHLAARNILLTSSLEAKVAGFGPTRETEQDQDKGKEKVAIKWMAPECMTSVKDATLQSDVWSYGIVLWEIFSMGETPYPGLRSTEVATKVSSGYRMSRPEFCADMHYELMKKCWKDKKASRPEILRHCTGDQ